MSPPEVTRYVEAARRGDHEAFEQLVRLTYHDTYTLAFRLTGNEEDARDVVQETYLRTYRSIGRFRGDAQFSTWLYRITANCAASASARSARHRHVELAPDAPVLDPRADHDPAQHVDATTLRTRLEAAIADLPPRLRQVIVLRDVYELPHDQIAAELGISESAAKVRLHRARRMLRERLFREINAMPYECRDIVSEMLDETSVVSLAHRQHVEQCADCRLDLNTQRAVRSSIRVLRTERIEPPADLLAQLYADLRRYAASPSRRLARLVRVAPYVGGVLAAGAAGAVLAGRTRRTRFGIV